MTRDDLVNAGYQKYTSTINTADAIYQKRVGNTRQYYYDMSKVSNIVPYKEGFECRIQFKVQGDYLNLDFNCRDLTIEQLESKVEWLFTTLGAEDYA